MFYLGLYMEAICDSGTTFTLKTKIFKQHLCLHRKALVDGSLPFKIERGGRERKKVKKKILYKI